MRSWLQQGTANHLAEATTDFIVKKLFSIVTSGRVHCGSVRRTDLSAISIHRAVARKAFGTITKVPPH